MTNEDKLKIEEMHKNGLGYKRIASALSISQNTIKAYFRRKSDNNKKVENVIVDDEHCLFCGKDLVHKEKHKKRLFCSDSCRYKWWNRNRDKIKNGKTIVCKCCGRKFKVGKNSKKKYCTYDCYIKDRFGGISNGNE